MNIQHEETGRLQEWPVEDPIPYGWSRVSESFETQVDSPERSVMKTKIKDRYGKVLFEADANSLRETVILAVQAKADLRGADLRGADLSGADLRGAYLIGAYLIGADLSGADLRGAYLIGTYLGGADLSGADLSGAYLIGTYLIGADLRGVEKIATKEESTATLDKIREIVLPQPERLRMEHWHGENWDHSKIPETPGACGTTHCLAGWAQALSTDPEIRKFDAQKAGLVLIPTATHMFFASNERALKFLKDREYA